LHRALSQNEAPIECPVREIAALYRLMQAERLIHWGTGK